MAIFFVDLVQTLSYHWIITSKTVLLSLVRALNCSIQLSSYPSYQLVSDSHMCIFCVGLKHWGGYLEQNICGSHTWSEEDHLATAKEMS